MVQIGKIKVEGKRIKANSFGGIFGSEDGSTVGTNRIMSNWKNPGRNDEESKKALQYFLDNKLSKVDDDPRFYNDEKIA